MAGVKIVLVATALAVAGCDSPEQRVENHYGRGVSLMAEGAPEKAVLEFRNALRINENHAPSRLEIAQLYERDGEWRAAASNYRLVTELDPDNALARVKLAQLLIAGGQVEEAQSHIARAMALAPNDPEVITLDAQMALRGGDAARAVARANEALAVDPGNVAAAAVLIAERLRAEDADAAVAMADAMLAQAPEDRMLNLLKLQALNVVQRPEALVEHLRRMTALFPEEAGLRRTLASQLARRGDAAGAEAELRALAEMTESDPEPALELVRFVRASRGADAARTELERLVAATPDTARALPFISSLAALDFAAGDGDAARGRLEAALADADAASARTLSVRLAELEFRGGDIEAARTRIDAVLAQDAADVDALLMRAELLIAEDRAQDAIADLRTARDAAPDDSRVMLASARVFELVGNRDLAGERYAAAARATGFAPDTVRLYARFLLSENRLEAAASVLTESFRNHPTDRGVAAQLGVLRLRLQDWSGAEETAAALRAAGGPSVIAGDQIAAAALAGQGRHAESTALLERSASETDQRGGLAILVRSLAGEGRIDEAAERLDAAIAADPSDAIALMLRADLHNAFGDPAEAERMLRAAIESEPANAAAHMGLTRFLATRGRADEADAALSKGLEMTGGALGLREMRAALFEARGDFDGAIAAWRDLYEARPDSLIYANNFASLTAEHRADDPASLDHAARVAQRLRGLPTPALQDTYGWILFLQGRSEEALRHLVPAAEGAPDNPIIRYHAGRVYAALGRSEEARSHLEAALAVNGNFPKADSARETLAGLPPATTTQ
jgi:predicted Zn-dependent protease